MLTEANVMAFVATSKPDAARAFYRDVLGLKLVSDEPWALVFEARGAPLRVQKVPEHAPAPFTALGWSVADIVSTMRGLAQRGVHFERYDGLAHDDGGVWQSPSGARVAWFKDPDGNTLSITQFP